MNASDLKILEKLDPADKEKVSHFLRLLLNKSKYKKLKAEIANRRKQIKRGDSLTHDEIWDLINV